MKPSSKVLLAIASVLFLFTCFSLKELTLFERIDQLKKEKKIVILTSEEINTQQNKKISPVEVALGKLLFYEKKLSRNNNISCASCHIPEKGFSNGETFGTGTNQNHTKRHVPHLYNLSLNTTLFWDGRVNTLEEQLSKVITSKEEMDMTFKELLVRLNQDSEYKKKFYEVYKEEEITRHTLTRAMVSFERSLIALDSPYDRFIQGDTTALTSLQKKGMTLFIGKANCISCHNGKNMTDNGFHNVGIRTSDLGRHAIDKVGMSNEFESTPYPFFSMFKAFKTPSLRNVGMTAPYFHDGSKKTLREVLELYNKGGENPDKTGLAKEIMPLNLEESELDALESFLQALTSSKNNY
jgi:cytochrome c peroxidase